MSTFRCSELLSSCFSFAEGGQGEDGFFEVQEGRWSSQLCQNDRGCSCQLECMFRNSAAVLYV